VVSREKHAHTPTRICPHAWCRRLHFGLGLLALIDIVVLLTRGSGGQSLGNVSMFWLISGIVGVAGYAVSRVVLGHSTGQLVKLDRLDKLRGIELVARPVWAAIAAATDILNLGLMGLFGMEALSGQVGPAEMTGLDQAMLLGGMAFACGWQAFRDFAHRMAVKPVKPKRVTVPALGTAGV
jgi:hypothetical protein